MMNNVCGTPVRHLAALVTLTGLLTALAGHAPVSAQVPGGTPPASAAWKEANAGYRYQFPQDHASHPDYKIEWWYYTGNVQSRDGRHFGYQVTFFRVGVDRAPVNPSVWAVRDLYMAHLAVSDPSGQRYRYAEKLTRSGPGLSGAATDRYRVWNEEWSAAKDADGRHVLRAPGREVGVELVLDEGKPPVINGINGISQKGARPGNASHYYSLTRMPTRGTLIIDGERIEVTGDSWMDREFGSSFLETGQQGWDWLSLQLSDGRELMLYQLRLADGTRDPRSSGTLIDSVGRTTHLVERDFTQRAIGAPEAMPSGAKYPLRWQIEIPSQGLSLQVTTPLRNQELTTAGAGISYWEGMVEMQGTSRGTPVTGRGYLEMTGYRGSIGRVLTQ
jgi:predicted secreted hydrolase